MANDIALQVQPIKLDNPVQQYANVLSLQNAQNQNRLADFQYKTGQEQYARQNQLRNALAASGGDEAAYGNALTQYGSPEQVAAYRKAKLEGEKTSAELQKLKLETGLKAKEFHTGLLTNVKTPEDAARWVAAQYSDPLLAPIVSRGAPLEKAIANIPSDPEGFQSWLQKNAMGMASFVEKSVQKPMIAGGAVIQSNAMAPGFMGKLGDVAPTAGDKLRGANEPFKADGTPNVPVQTFQLGKARAGATNVTTKQEGAFEGALGKGQAEELLKGRQGADDAAEILNTVNVGRGILNSGMVTGFGADAIVQIGQALKQAGIDVGGDATANSQAYSAAMAQNVGKLIKQFGSGTGLSNADREYAEKMAGGKITMDKNAIVKILDINERAAKNIITRHNQRAKGVKTNVPLTVEIPASTPIKQSPKSVMDAADAILKGG